MSRDVCLSYFKPVSNDCNKIICCECQYPYQTGKCSGTKESSFKGKHDSARKSWRCPTCYSSKLRCDCSSAGNPAEQPVTQDPKAFSVIVTRLDKITIQLDGLSEVPGQVKSLEESMQFMNTKFETLLAKYEEITKQNKAVKEDNQSLLLQNQELTNRVNSLEQYSRANNVEIKGIPVTQNENCVAIIQKIGEEVGCTVETSDIDACHRVSTFRNASEKNLIGTFCLSKST